MAHVSLQPRQATAGFSGQGTGASHKTDFQGATHGQDAMVSWRPLASCMGGREQDSRITSYAPARCRSCSSLNWHVHCARHGLQRNGKDKPEGKKKRVLPAIILAVVKSDTARYSWLLRKQSLAHLYHDNGAAHNPY